MNTAEYAYAAHAYVNIPACPSSEAVMSLMAGWPKGDDEGWKGEGSTGKREELLACDTADQEMKTNKDFAPQLFTLTLCKPHTFCLKPRTVRLLRV